MNLNELSDIEIKIYLKSIIKSDQILTESELAKLKSYETPSYDIIGLIGLLLNDPARILLGAKQSLDLEVQSLCLDKKIQKDELYKIAEKYLIDDLDETAEYIYQQVMLEYPKDK